MQVTVAVDCMGGDYGPPVTVPAVLSFLSNDPEVSVVLVGLSELIQVQLNTLRPAPALLQRLRIAHASQVVAMDEAPASALRGKKDSSIRVAVNLLKNREADAFVSAGNTGALMAISRYVLKTLPGIDRPAIATVLPALNGHVYVLDLGANVDCTAEHLLQFAVMGSAMVSRVENKAQPTVGLLNIGEEDIKGNEVVKKTAHLLRESKLNFYGNVEGNDIFKGTTDIVVCDGFVGNVVLKASEGLAKMMSGMIREEFNRSWLTKLMALCAMVPLLRVRKRVDHRRYNGAVLLGLRGCVIKSHGSADRFGFGFALDRAYEASKNRMVDRIAAAFAAETRE